MKWERADHGDETAVEGGAGGPGKRWGHTCSAIRGGRFVYVFGGYGKDNCQTNLVHVFDSVNQTWSQPTIKGTPPTPRDNHSCTVVCDNLFIFGGTDGKNPLKDLHILDTSSHTWISPSVRGEGPEAREGHSAALAGKRLFVFGGCGKSSDNNDLYILNTETFVWKKAVTTGTQPSAREGHTCSSWKNKVIVIGGEDGHDRYLSDVHILDADTLMWKELDTTGQMLPPRAGHSTVAFGKILFVFGGFTEAQNLYEDLYMLDLDTGLWSKVTTMGHGPSARFSMAGDSLDPLRSGVIFFIGGCNKSLEALGDIYYLHTGLIKEDERKLEKLSLRKQLKLKCQEQNLTSGSDKHLPRVIPGAGNCHPGANKFSPTLSEPLQGKMIFHAKVTESFCDGYTIETVINGKSLRGVVFPNKPRTLQMPLAYTPRRKRASADSETVTSNGNHGSKSKTQRTGQQDSEDIRPGEVLQRKGITPPEAPTEAPGSSLVEKILEFSGPSAPFKIPGTRETSVAATDVEEEQRNDAPIKDNLEKEMMV